MLKQSLNHKLLHKLSPQQIQFIKLLQIPTALLEQRVKQELEENPALEEGNLEEKDEYEKLLEDKFGDDDAEDDKEDEYAEKEDDFDVSEYLDYDETPDYKLGTSNYNADDEQDSYQAPVTVSTSFYDRMVTQLHMLELEEEDYKIAEQIIGSLDQSGYLRRSQVSLVDDLAFSQNVIAEEEDVVRLLKMVQRFDPPGVGARTLKECLLLQLYRKEPKTDAITLAIDIVENHFDEYSKKHYNKLIKHLKVDLDSVKLAHEEILKLNPKPGNTAADNSKTMQIIPDFVIYNEEGELKLKLNARNAPELRVSSSYKEMLSQYKEQKKKDKKLRETLTFVKQKLDSAKWFIDAVRQRQHTLLITMQCIMNLQNDFFRSGDEVKLRPMILKDIAEEVGLDISTISRVANSKYVQTEFGTFLLKSFFSEGIKTESGEDASSKEVKQILKNWVNQENKQKPLSDDKLAVYLNNKGYSIARRTVAKYREQLGIPVARLRKQL